MAVVNSILLASTLVGMDVTLAHPEKFDILPEAVAMAESNAKKNGSKFEIVHDMDEACTDADIVYAKGWGPIMHVGNDEAAGLEMIEANPGWIVDQRRMDLAKEHAIYMHCMPADVGSEVTEEVMYGPQSVLYDEAENRMHTIKAVMVATLGA